MTDNEEFVEYDRFSKMMVEKFPLMFASKYGGFAVGKGWWPILESLCANIQSHIDWRNKNRQSAIEYNTVAEAGKSGNADLFADLCAKRFGVKGYDEAYVRSRCEEMIREPLRKVPDECPQVVVAQIKEKFGGLRFYYDGGDDTIDGMVRMAEAWASVSCEECGAPGVQRPGGWVKTLCDHHAAEREARYRRYAKENGFEE